MLTHTHTHTHTHSLSLSLSLSLNAHFSQIGTQYHDHGPDRKQLVRNIDIKSLDDLTSPFVTCISMDRGDGFEERLRAKGFIEGIDFYLFG